MHQQKRRAKNKEPEFDENDIAVATYTITCINRNA